MNDRNLFLTVLKAEKPKIKVLGDSVPGKSAFSGLHTAASISSHVLGGECDLQGLFLQEYLIFLDQGPVLMYSLILVTFIKVLFPNTVTLWVGLQYPDFGGTQLSPCTTPYNNHIIFPCCVTRFSIDSYASCWLYVF